MIRVGIGVQGPIAKAPPRTRCISRGTGLRNRIHLGLSLNERDETRFRYDSSPYTDSPSSDVYSVTNAKPDVIDRTVFMDLLTPLGYTEAGEIVMEYRSGAFVITNEEDISPIEQDEEGQDDPYGIVLSPILQGSFPLTTVQSSRVPL